uniref:E3 ubiquitin-protein ligase TRIM39-like n=1 Tax=Semicossyphus pulcher TaxID=241346 RepID=UPI0037E83ACC
MASASCVLSEDRFLCSICLDVFTQPVSTPCGHSFCSACIHKYWDSSDTCQCPFCKEIFSPRPELKVNTFISELAAEFKKLVQVKTSTPDTQRPETADVLCDICTEKKGKAVKSCLTCLVSYCEPHLEPHQRVAGLKSHTLLDPVRNLDDRMCKTHSKMTDLYCRTDQACICVLCLKTNHKGHNVVPLEEEYEAVLAKKEEAMANIQKMKQSRSKKMADIENSIAMSEKEAEKEKEASVQVFTDLISSIQKSQAELVEVIEERYRATKQKAEDFITELRQEVVELESRSSQLEQLWKSEDHHLLLQSFPTLCSPLHKNWADISVHSDLSFEAERGDVNLLKQRVGEIMERIPEIKMKRMREHAVDLTFDPDTAHQSIFISTDGKQVTFAKAQLTLPDNPKRFAVCSEVLAKEGFTTGKFYYEVQVKGKTDWILGVVNESFDRKQDTSLSVNNGAWAIGFDDHKFTVYTKKSTEITLKEKPQKMGVFVDYNKGVVSFYNVDSKSHIYSFTWFNFKEKVYPYFCLQGSTNRTNSAPLVITPVPQTY